MRLRSYYPNHEHYWKLVEAQRTPNGLPENCWNFIGIHTLTTWKDTKPYYSLTSPLCLCRYRDTKFVRRPNWEYKKFTTHTEALAFCRKLISRYQKIARRSIHIVNCIKQTS